MTRSTPEPRKPRAPERDYSHRLLIDKLEVKPGQRVAVLGVDGAEFMTGLAARVPEYSRGERIKGADLIFFSAEARDDLIAAEITGEVDQQERSHLGGLSERSESHSGD